MTQQAQKLCQLCGEPMPESEEMFNYHGYSGPCPKPPKERQPDVRPLVAEAERFFDSNNSRGAYDAGNKRNGFARFAAAFHQFKTPPAASLDGTREEFERNDGRGEAAEWEQNKAGLASSGVTLITPPLSNERPSDSDVEFQQWASAEGFNIEHDSRPRRKNPLVYRNSHTRLLWLGWQASRSSERERARIQSACSECDGDGCAKCCEGCRKLQAELSELTELLRRAAGCLHRQAAQDGGQSDLALEIEAALRSHIEGE